MKRNSKYSNALQSIFEKILVVGNKWDSSHIVAFSGGCDSSVVAATVFTVFPHNSFAVIGKSASLPNSQLVLARNIAKQIGIPLMEVQTTEGSSGVYIKNEGLSCYSCKTHLYSALQDVYFSIMNDCAHQSNPLFATDHPGISNKVALYNGTNKDDLTDTTRVGLKAANEFHVISPIDHLSKAEVREVAFELKLPNYAHAASPCLRSRLAFGVQATSQNLNRIEIAENIVRTLIQPEIQHNVRVRHMIDDSASVELDKDLLESKQYVLEIVAQEISKLGFNVVKFNVFRSGSVAKMSKTQ